MKQHKFSRTELLIGNEPLEALKEKKIVILGIGGVGSYCTEALARSGIENLILVDDDEICLTNINRQVHALKTTIGKSKVKVMKERILEINPKAKVQCHQTFINKENVQEVIPLDANFVVDAIDTVSAKISTVLFCKENNINLISSLGTGNKFHPEMFEITDLYKTEVCPLARVMRYELRKRGVKKLNVLYSKEKPVKPKTGDVISCKECCVCTGDNNKCTVRRQIPGSMSYVPPVAGFIIASHVINNFLGK
ncbi:MAG: ThiF family adenylyltransferase [Lachnospirales bacterium]